MDFSDSFSLGANTVLCPLLLEKDNSLWHFKVYNLMYHLCDMHSMQIVDWWNELYKKELFIITKEEGTSHIFRYLDIIHRLTWN